MTSLVIALGVGLYRLGADSYIAHTALPTIAKLGAAKVFGGLGIGLLGWQAAAVVGSALLLYGLYRFGMGMRYKCLITAKKTLNTRRYHGSQFGLLDDMDEGIGGETGGYRQKTNAI